MRTPLLLSAALLTTALLTSASALAADPCPQDFRHERTGIFHKSPEQRLTGGKSAGGRVCLHIVRPSELPDQWGAIRSTGQLQCPSFYKLERAGVLHDSPKKRLSQTFRNPWNTRLKQRYACLAILRPDAKQSGKPWDPAADTAHRRAHKVVRWVGGDFVDYPGTRATFFKASAPSVEQCMNLCMNHARCQYATFDTRAKKCHLKAGAIVLKPIGSRIALRKVRRSGSGFKADGYASPLFKQTADRACPSGNPPASHKALMQVGISPNSKNCPATCASAHDCRYFIQRKGACTLYRLKPEPSMLNAKDRSCAHFKSTAGPLKARKGGGGRA